jgi:Luciferase-like monooxygenase
MRLGLNLGSSRRRHLVQPGAGPSPPQIPLDIPLVPEAERLGYYVVWSAEAYGSDAIVPLAWVGALTSTIHLGTAITQIPGRTPANAAMGRGREIFTMMCSSVTALQTWLTACRSSTWPVTRMRPSPQFPMR